MRNLLWASLFVLLTVASYPPLEPVSAAQNLDISSGTFAVTSNTVYGNVAVHGTGTVRISNGATLTVGGSLSLADTGQLIMDQGNLLLQGNGSLRGTSTLSIGPGSVFTLQQLYPQQYGIDLFDSSVLSVRGSLISNFTSLTLHGQSSLAASGARIGMNGCTPYLGHPCSGIQIVALYQSGVNISGGSTIDHLTIFGTSSALVQVHDSTIGFELGLPSSGSVQFPRGLQAVWDSNTAIQSSIPLTYRITLVNTTVADNVRELDVWPIQQTVTLSNSRDVLIGVGLVESRTFTFPDLSTPGSATIDVSGGSFLNVVNSSIAGWDIFPTPTSAYPYSGNGALVANSSRIDVVAQPSSLGAYGIEIINSSISWVYSYSGTSVKIYNSQITGFVEADPGSGIYLANTKVTSALGQVSALRSEGGRIYIASVLGYVANNTNGVTVVGTAIILQSGLKSYKLEFGLGNSPATWTTIASSTNPVFLGSLGVWNVQGLAATTYTLKLTLTDNAGQNFGTTSLASLPAPKAVTNATITLDRSPAQYRAGDPMSISIGIVNLGPSKMVTIKMFFITPGGLQWSVGHVSVAISAMSDTTTTFSIKTPDLGKQPLNLAWKLTLTNGLGAVLSQSTVLWTYTGH